jgi:virginiamycin B lyase
MRLLTGISLTILLSAATPPKMGVRTPGVLIPAGGLKAEAEFALPAHPAWIAIAGGVVLPGATGLDRIDPKAKEAKLGEPVAGIDKACGGAVSAFDSLWAPSCGEGALMRVDPKTAKVTAKVAIGAGPIAATPDSIWMLADSKTTLARIDPKNNEVVSELRLPAGCTGLLFAETSLWVACPAENRVMRITPLTGLVDKSIEVSADPRGLAAGESSIWVLCRKDGKVDRIDPKTNKVSKTIDLGVPDADGAIAAGEGSIWVTLAGFPITRIQPGTERVVQQFYGPGGGAIQAGMGFVWLSNTAKGTLWKLDSKRIAATLAE